jgi:hypothetical protein
VTPATTLGIRRCALVIVTIVTTIVRTAMIFCFFDLIYFWDLVPFVSLPPWACCHYSLAPHGSV